MIACCCLCAMYYSGDGIECPICGVKYPIDVIEQHAATCEPGKSAPVQPAKVPASAPPGAENDPDFLFALRLQAELDAESAREREATVTCGLCNKPVPVSDIYILDVCYEPSFP